MRKRNKVFRMEGDEGGMEEERTVRKRGREEGSSSEEEEGGSKRVVEREREDGGRKVVVRFDEDGQRRIKSLGAMKLTKVLQEKMGSLEFVKVLNDGNLLVGCGSQERVKVVLGVKSVGGAKVVSSGVVGEKRGGNCKGIATQVPLWVKVEELVENGEGEVGGKIVRAKRMSTSRDGGRVETETVLVEFEGDRRPSKIFLGILEFDVREFVENPVRCFRCQDFGHMARLCKREKRCGQCGGVGHELRECREQPKCCHCGEGHRAGYWGCEKSKLEVVVQDIRRKEGVTYAEALKRGKEGGGVIERESVGGVRGGGEEEGGVVELVRRNMEGIRKEMSSFMEQMKSEMLGVLEESFVSRVEEIVRKEREKVVMFVAGVLNGVLKGEVGALQNRVQIVVKAAACHLGVKGLKWSEVFRELSVQAGPSGSGGQRR